VTELDSDLSAGERQMLEALHFRFAEFRPLQAALHADTLPDNTVRGRVEVPQPETFSGIPTGDEGAALARRGGELIGSGAAALLLLNGGMATRFGGRVKGVIDALPGHSFLSLQMGRLRALRSTTASCPLLLMNSRATDTSTREHLEANHYFGMAGEDVFTFTQSGAPRLRADGTLYRDAHGELSIYGPGHGDLLPSLRRSGALQWARERGVSYLLCANVDNLAATLDERLLGLFAQCSSEMMGEVCTKERGDIGGSPVWVDGRLQIVEDFAFPEAFDKQSIPVFNTNTLWFRCDALARELPLSWYEVRKQVDGTEIVQFEQLVGQASWFLDSLFTRVPRQRFQPVKTPEDLRNAQESLRRMFPEASGQGTAEPTLR